MEAAGTAVCESPRPSKAVYAAVGVVLFLVAVSGLYIYKWGGSMRVLGGDPAALRARAETLREAGLWSAVVYYFGAVWKALVYGVLIGATVRAFISPRWIASLLGSGAKGQVVGGLAGAPLMLCSCCVTPVFSGVYERGARLGPSLAVMLAAPGLNPAALVLTFVLFPIEMSLARLGGALVSVFLLSAAVGKVFGDVRRGGPAASCPADEPIGSFGALVWRFVKSLGYMTVVTVPLIGAGVVLSSLLLPGAVEWSTSGAVAATAIIALIGVMIALPTFFEIPLALILWQMGAPGAATALLIAGPIINLPSLFVLGRETNAKVAVALGLGIWVVSALAGAAVSA